MNWNDPVERAHLIARVGVEEYARQLDQHLKENIITVVAGHAIRPVGTRFGILYAVGATRTAFKTLEKAKDYAKKNPATK